MLDADEGGVSDSGGYGAAAAAAEEEAGGATGEEESAAEEGVLPGTRRPRRAFRCESYTKASLCLGLAPPINLDFPLFLERGRGGIAD